MKYARYRIVHRPRHGYPRPDTVLDGATIMAAKRAAGRLLTESHRSDLVVIYENGKRVASKRAGSKRWVHGW